MRQSKNEEAKTLKNLSEIRKMQASSPSDDVQLHIPEKISDKRFLSCVEESGILSDIEIDLMEESVGEIPTNQLRVIVKDPMTYGLSPRKRKDRMFHSICDDELKKRKNVGRILDY